MDWLSIAGLWLATAILAIKTGDLDLIAGAPSFLTSSLWGYVPFALTTISGALLLYRHYRPRPAPVEPLPEAPLAVAQARDRVLPDMRISDLGMYLRKVSEWGEGLSDDPDVMDRQINLEVGDKLALGALKGWIRHATDAPLMLAQSVFWERVRIRWATGTASFEGDRGKVPYFDPQVNTEEARKVWPPKQKDGA